MTEIGPPRDLVGYGRRPPRATWPDDARLVVNLVLIYEEGSEYSILEGDRRNDGWGEYAPSADPPVRDLGTETHYEYGSRAGIWRLARLVEQYQIPATVSATAVALERNREVAAWMRETGHDLLGHGWRWTELWTLSWEEEHRQLLRAIDLYREILGERPLGWNSRSFPSVNTRDLLVEEGGFLYDSDPCNDDLPYFVDVGGTRLLVVPYSKTTNDARYLTTPGFASPRDFSEQCRAAMDELWREGATHPKMMTIAVHARWSGQPARAAALRDVLEHAAAKDGVRFMRRVDIARWWIERSPGFRAD